MAKRIELSDFATLLEGAATEVSSAALGGKALAASDEWFCPASDLLKVGPALSLKGQFGPRGALFDGWETRRHNPEWTDWAIIRLGPRGGATIIGFDIDTANFNGNEAPEAEVYGLYLDPSEEKEGSAAPSHDDSRWSLLLPRAPCGPSQRHLWTIPESKVVTHVKLNMIPDGGIARFRVYGRIPAPPVGLGVAEKVESDPRFNSFDLAHSMNGGRVVFTSDQHFGKGPNILLPGRGKDMGDGWETRRSRTPGHKDWLVIKLSEPGYLSYAEIDTAHFLGNFPESVELHGIEFDGDVPPGTTSADGTSASAGWFQLLERKKTGPGKQHYFGFGDAEKKRISHVRVTMHPDGGIKRVRLVGRRAGPLAGHSGSLPALTLPAEDPTSAADILKQAANATLEIFGAGQTGQSGSTQGRAAGNALQKPYVPSVPLTPQSFSSYGQVIAGPAQQQDTNTPHAIVNQGTARKYAHQAEVKQTFPAEAKAQTNMHLYRCDSIPEGNLPVALKMLERHRFSSQSFVPLESPGHAGRYLVVVAQNGADDKPDLSTLASFVATGRQAICYYPGTWHLPMTPIGPGGPLDYACIVAESDVQPELNCDEHWWGEEKPAAFVGL